MKQVGLPELPEAISRFGVEKAGGEVLSVISITRGVLGSGCRDLALLQIQGPEGVRLVPVLHDVRGTSVDGQLRMDLPFKDQNFTGLTLGLGEGRRLRGCFSGDGVLTPQGMLYQGSFLADDAERHTITGLFKTGELGGLDPLTVLSVSALPDGKLCQVLSPDGHHFIEERGLSRTVGSPESVVLTRWLDGNTAKVSTQALIRRTGPEEVELVLRQLGSPDINLVVKKAGGEQLCFLEGEWPLERRVYPESATHIISAFCVEAPELLIRIAVAHLDHDILKIPEDATEASAFIDCLLQKFPAGRSEVIGASPVPVYISSLVPSRQVNPFASICDFLDFVKFTKPTSIPKFVPRWRAEMHDQNLPTDDGMYENVPLKCRSGVDVVLRSLKLTNGLPVSVEIEFTSGAGIKKPFRIIANEGQGMEFVDVPLFIVERMRPCSVQDLLLGIYLGTVIGSDYFDVVSSKIGERDSGETSKDIAPLGGKRLQGIDLDLDRLSGSPVYFCSEVPMPGPGEKNRRYDHSWDQIDRGFIRGAQSVEFIRFGKVKIAIKINGHVIFSGEDDPSSFYNGVLPAGEVRDVKLDINLFGATMPAVFRGKLKENGPVDGIGLISGDGNLIAVQGNFDHINHDPLPGSRVIVIQSGGDEGISAQEYAVVENSGRIEFHLSPTPSTDPLATIKEFWDMPPLNEN